MSLLEKIEIFPIGYVKRTSNEDDTKNRQIISKIVINKDLVNGLDGIEEFSHIFIIYWLDKVSKPEKPILHHPRGKKESNPIGMFTTRAPIHPNPIGLTLVELMKREDNVLLVKGLDAYDQSPVLDIKPYPDWDQGELQVITDFKIPKWLKKLLKENYK
ncbi:MAG: tRNA (N6-threonylcarbamoyladenosine(37)-N6)-methyltransferase TrmO [Candidatus Hodarchaeales archaeon]|jgi:tRNA-Thr(GGU) m(6)t(6)A37 methyltransferase TsaA